MRRPFQPRSLALRLLLALCLALTWGGQARAAGVGSPPDGEVQAPHASAFSGGVEAYRRGRYEEAAQRWRSILGAARSDAERARLAYDLGCAAYRLGRPLETVGWCMIALELDPRHADARHNLERARAEAGLPPADRGDLTSTLRRAVTAWTPTEARRLLAFGLALFALALLGEALRGGRGWRRVAWAALGLLVLASLPRMALAKRTLAGRVLAVRAPEVALRSEPRQELEPIASLPAGDVATRVDELPGWVRVQLESGARGWVPEAAVMRLDPFGASTATEPEGER